MAEGKVNWYEQDALLQVDAASAELVTKLAFLVEGYAKVNAKVDTGFMRNAIYTIPARGRPRETGPSSGSFRSKATGEMVERKRVSGVPQIPDGYAAVHSAAEYSIYREVTDHFLYNALVKVRLVAPGVIRGVGKSL